MTEVIVEDSRGGKHPSRFRTIGSSAAAISSLEEVEPSDGVRIRTGIASLTGPLAAAWSLARLC